MLNQIMQAFPDTAQGIRIDVVLGGLPPGGFMASFFPWAGYRRVVKIQVDSNHKPPTWLVVVDSTRETIIGFPIQGQAGLLNRPKAEPALNKNLVFKGGCYLNIGTIRSVVNR